MSEWSDMSNRGLLFQWASTMKTRLSVFVKNKADLIIISFKINLFSPWYIGKRFKKGVNFSCLKISNIPYNSMFTQNFNDFSILITIISGAYLDLFVMNECVGDVTIPTQVIMYNQSYSTQINQSDCSIRINYW
jgi:hypothetical protein